MRKTILFDSGICILIIGPYSFNRLEMQCGEKRENTFTYLFGRELTKKEKQEAHRQAERLPRIIAIEEKKGGYFPPETAPANLYSYSRALIETAAIATWGSLLAFLAAIPVSLFAAKNTLALIVQGDGSASRWIRWFSQFGVRRFLDFCRGFNEFVMA